MTLPVRAQYLRLKRLFPDALLLFRLGDFYELFDADARVVARELELPLTARDFGDGTRIAMCAVPYHAVERRIKQLVARGYKVAIAEQIGDPRTAKGLVVREVVRVVSPSSAVRPPVAPTSHDGAKRTTFFASDSASTTSNPPMSTSRAIDRAEAVVTQLTLFDINAHGSDRER